MEELEKKNLAVMWGIFTLVFLGIFFMTISLDLKYSNKGFFENGVVGNFITERTVLEQGDILYDNKADQYYVLLDNDDLAYYDDIAESWVKRDYKILDGFLIRMSKQGEKTGMIWITAINTKMPVVVKNTLGGTWFSYIDNNGEEVIVNK